MTLVDSTSNNVGDAPQWPSLGKEEFLTRYSHIWLFIVIWTMVFCVSVYTLCGIWAALMLPPRTTSISLRIGVIPIFMFVGILAAFISGTPVGLVVGTLYEAGKFKMPTEIAMTWGLLLSLYMILGSFSSSTLFI